MNIFQDFLTKSWTKSVKSRRDAEMASISNGHSFGKATSLPGTNIRSICSPFRRLEGAIRKGLFARLTRQDVIVSATKIASLRRFKDDVDEVRAGLECGVVLEDTNDIKPGDNLEVFSVEERERTL